MLLELQREVLSALRSARRRPVFSLGVVTTLALAIGANTAIFALVDGALLRRLPFGDPERLVMVHVRESDADQPVSIADFFDLRDAAQSFDALVAWGGGAANLTGVEEPVRLAAQWVSAGFFEAMDVQPALGRAPLPEEERPGAPRVVLLGNTVWRALFASDPEIVGQILTIEGEPFTVIGVLAPDFVFMNPQSEVIAPFHLETDPRRANRGGSFLRVIGRLAPGVTPETAAAELDALVARLRETFPDSNGSQQGVRLEPLAERVVGGFRRTLLALQAAVSILLLLACANLANLFAARATSRHGELALRLALGAGRRDLARQLGLEAVTLAVLGGALGLGVATVMLRLLLAFGADRLPRVGEIGIDGRAVAFALTVSVVVGLGLAVLPALRAGAAGLARGIGETGRGGATAPRRGPSRKVLLVVEAMLAFVLLAVGGLMMRSFHRLQSVDPGYRPDRLLSLQLSLPKMDYATPEALTRYGEEAVARLSALPGVETAAVTSVTPLAPWRAWIHFTIEGRDAVPREQAPVANYRAVGPGYFAAMGIPLRAGRDVDARDRGDAVAVAIVSETLAERHFPGGSAPGARLTIDDGGTWRTVEVVGVVGDVKHTGLDAEDTADVYVPYAQTPSGVSIWLANLFCVVVRTHGPPENLAPVVRRQLRELDPDVTVGLGSMEAALSSSLSQRRLDTMVLATFGAAALALALLGIYAVAAIGVAERRPEIAVRMSLGAGRGRIVGLVVGGALAPVAVGLLAGLTLTLAVGRLLGSLLFGVAPHDPVTLVGACVALAVATLAASVVPALRALRVDPVTVQRAS
jgi:putative ABC transport system permease protein